MITVRTEDFFWTLAALSVADTIPLTVKFQSSDELSLQALKMAGAVMSDDTPSDVFPLTDEQCHEIELFADGRSRAELRVYHGINLPEPENPQILTIDKIVAQYFIWKYETVTKPGLFKLKVLPTTDPIGVYTRESYKDQAEAFARGLEMEGEVRYIGDLPYMEQLQFVAPGATAGFVLTSAGHPVVAYLKSRYVDYDHLKGLPLCFTLLPGDPEGIDLRKHLVWAGCLLSKDDHPVQGMEDLAKAWLLRQRADFDHIRFARENKLG